MRFVLRAIGQQQRNSHYFRRRFCASTTSAAASASDTRTLLVEHALKHVHSLGWSQNALAQAALDLGLPPLSSSLVHRGPVEIVEHLLKLKRAHVKAIVDVPRKVSNNGGDALGSPDQELYHVIEAHLDFLAPYRQSWPSALALLAEPQNAVSTLALVQELSDDLSVMAGIRASRMDWYAERGLLVSLYGATEMYLLTDSSDNLEDTKRFLKRSIDTYSTARTLLSLTSLASQSR